ncbi:hypothetical protein [Nonomuraea sp. NPDC049709]|uniref:hypothetical protein n=1 Tax=Nonomuraea sp. NPDC049709 TaxID=3154736 RepID=UPI00341F2A4B
MLGGTLIQVPAVWVPTGVGIDYRIAKYVVPFPNLPMVLSGEPFAAAPILVMTAVTAALTATGLAALKRRPLT